MIPACRKCGQWMSTRRLAAHEPGCTGGKGRANLSPKPQGRPKILLTVPPKGVLAQARV